MLRVLALLAMVFALSGFSSSVKPLPASMHAFGLAVDLNPVENPYVGCGQTRDSAARRYRDRSRHRRGMVTARAISAFRSIGWGWGGSWTGDTKDYMHFSSTGH